MSIKVCGVGVISAIGVGCGENLDSLLSQRCGIGRNTLFHTIIDVPVGDVKLSNGELKDMLGLPQSQSISRTSLLGAIAAREAMGRVEITPDKRVGLINSTSVGGMDLSEEFYREFSTNKGGGRLRDIVGHDCATSSDFIADQCNITGFRTTISTACSSAANAVIMGARMLECDMLDYVLVGGSDALCRFTLNGFNSLMILDKELCRPFDSGRSGLNLGEGAGYLLLTKEPTCEGICALSGYANANDAFHQTASSSDGEGAYRAMSEALRLANITAKDIDYVNLHGTGTGNNDLSETEAIKRVFMDSEIAPCSSTKSYTGHTLAASGGVEAVFSILSIVNDVRYGSLRFNTPIEDGITLLTETQRDLDINHVMSNSFGFGGNCSTLIFSK